MQNIDTGKFRQADRLHQLIGELRNEPGTDLRTLRRLDDKLTALGGVRLTVGRARRITARLAQARVLTTGLRPTEAARRIVEALNVSASTSWRYLARLKHG